MQKQKRITLNSEKRTAIANVFQSHFEREDSTVIKKYNKAKETYYSFRQQMKIFVEKIVRNQQPIEDVETIRSMINKYDSAGGQLYEDNCFVISSCVVIIYLSAYTIPGLSYKVNDNSVAPSLELF